MRTRHRTSVCAVLGLAIGLIACRSNGDTPTTASGAAGATSVTSAPAPSTDEVPSTGPAPRTTNATSAPSTVPPPAGVTVGTALTVDSFWSTRVIADGDEYVELATVDGQLMVSRSADGLEWTTSPTDLAIGGVWFAASNGDELFVSSGADASEAQSLSVSVSADGGSTWATSPLPVTPLDPGWLVQDVALDGLAVTGTAALAIGTTFVHGDWQRYAIEELGTDHGPVTDEGGDPTNWIITFEDGFQLTVDLDAIGLPGATTGFGPVQVAWLRTGSRWEPVSLPFAAAGAVPPQLVAGPAGFLASGIEADLTGGAQTTRLYSSLDGISWQADDLPAGFSESELPGGVFLVGGPLGYVLVGETRLAFSADATSWSTVAEFDDLVPDVSGFLSAEGPAAGRAGFAIAFSDPSRSGIEPRVLISHDGLTWEPVAMPPATLDAVVAVGDDSILVRPVVAAAPDGSAPAGSSIDTSVIETGGGAGGQRPAAMCDAPDVVTLVAYALDDGTYRWHLCGTGSTWYGFRAASNDVVYVSDIESGSDVLAIDAATGEVLATLSQGEMLAQVPDDAAVPMRSAPQLDGVQLTGGQDDPLVAIDADNGATLWSVDDPLAYDDVWAVGDGAVYMSHVELQGDERPTPTLRAYELRTGDVRWEVPMTTGAYYPWWFGDGRVFALWTDLTAIDSETGEVLWATDYATDTFPGMRGVIANDDTVFVAFTSHWGGGD